MADLSMRTRPRPMGTRSGAGDDVKGRPCDPGGLASRARRPMPTPRNRRSRSAVPSHRRAGHRRSRRSRSRSGMSSKQGARALGMVGAAPPWSRSRWRRGKHRRRIPTEPWRRPTGPAGFHRRPAPGPTHEEERGEGDARPSAAGRDEAADEIAEKAADPEGEQNARYQGDRQLRHLLEKGAHIGEAGEMPGDDEEDNDEAEPDAGPPQDHGQCAEAGRIHRRQPGDGEDLDDQRQGAESRAARRNVARQPHRSPR